VQTARKENSLGTVCLGTVNPPVSQLLQRLRVGDQSVLDQLTAALYDELRLIAARQIAGFCRPPKRKEASQPICLRLWKELRGFAELGRA